MLLLSLLTSVIVVSQNAKYVIFVDTKKTKPRKVQP